MIFQFFFGGGGGDLNLLARSRSSCSGKKFENWDILIYRKGYFARRRTEVLSNFISDCVFNAWRVIFQKTTLSCPYETVHVYVKSLRRPAVHTHIRHYLIECPPWMSRIFFPLRGKPASSELPLCDKLPLCEGQNFAHPWRFLWRLTWWTYTGLVAG